jgi:hypothetical protein
LGLKLRLLGFGVGVCSKLDYQSSKMDYKDSHSGSQIVFKESISSLGFAEYEIGFGYQSLGFARLFKNHGWNWERVQRLDQSH